MCVYTDILGFSIPSYGLMIVTGVIIANIISLFLHRKNSMDSYDLIIVEAYCLLGGFIGAKSLYLFISRDSIDWNMIGDPEYFSMLMNSGFVFYGGLIGGLLFALIPYKLHKIDVMYFLRRYAFMAPLAHGFGRIGCFCAGCCYGVPYDGPLAVVFPEDSFAIHGVKLFPVQIVEATGLLLIAIIVLFITIKLKSGYSIEIYLLLYAVLRFILENYRYDKERGIYLGLSTSQWIGIVMVSVAVISLFLRRKKTDKKMVLH